MTKAERTGDLTLRALEWLARLPLLGDEELALLLGVHELDAAKARRELDQLGWIEWVIAGSPEIRPRRLSFVRAEAVKDLAKLLDTSREDLERSLPLRSRDLLARIVAMEATVGINRLFADLAADPGVEAAIELADARGLPSGARGRDCWWPQAVDGYGCLRAGRLHAPFFVAWDRSGVPAAHRRNRISAWWQFARSESVWSSGGPPPIVVICAGEWEREQWAGEIGRRMERDGGSPLTVLLGTVSDVVTAGAGAEIWRPVGVRRLATLVERLEWGPKPSLALMVSPPAGVAEDLPSIDRSQPRLRERASRNADAWTDTRNERERLAALTLATDADEKLLIEWIGRHPLLEPAQLATLINHRVEATERRTDWLVRCGVVELISRKATADDSLRPRLVLADLGLRWLAARDLVPLSRYAKHGIVAATDDEGGTTGTRLEGFVRHFDHSVGLNRVFVRFAEDARKVGQRLIEWRNEAESTRRFRDDDRSYWIRPDGGGSLWNGEARHDFFVEYDRGTIDAAAYRSKLVGYHRYFTTRQFETDFASAPTVLVVAADDRAEEHAAHAVRAIEREFGSRLPLLLTSEWRYERDARNDAGLLGPIWRTADSNESRRLWPGAGRHTTTQPRAVREAAHRR